MRIVRQKVFVANARRTGFVFVKLHTDEGLEVVGEAMIVINIWNLFPFVAIMVTTRNESLFALRFATDSSVRTQPIGSAEFTTGFNTGWGAVMAASMIMTVPVAPLFPSTQRLFIGGPTAGATKRITSNDHPRTERHSAIRPRHRRAQGR